MPADDQAPLTTRLEVDDLKAFFPYFKSFSGIVTGLAAVFPAGFWGSGVLPVWAGAPLLAVVVSVLGVAIAFLGLRNRDAEFINRVAWRAIWASVGLLLAYIILLRLCVFETVEGEGADKDVVRVVTGFFLTQEARSRVANQQALSATQGDLLASFGYEHAEQAWWDARPIGVVIDLSFLLGNALLTFGCFCLVLRNFSADRERRQTVASQVAT